MYLTVKCPVVLVVPDAITHHDASDIVVRPLVRVVGPAFQHGDTHDAHVEDF
jgi:hypothetical protein